MAVQNDLSLAHLFVAAMRLAQRQAHAKKERALEGKNGFRTAPSVNGSTPVIDRRCFLRLESSGR
jgi:hypothetical protein